MAAPSVVFTIARAAAMLGVKIIWHDGVGMSLYMKRLERGRFIWRSPPEGCVSISGPQLAYMPDGIDWRNPQRSYRP